MIKEYVEKYLKSFYSKHNSDSGYDIQEYLAFESLLVDYSDWLSNEILVEKKECIICGAVESKEDVVSEKPVVVKEVVKESVKPVVEETRKESPKPTAKVIKKEVSVDDLMKSGELDLLK